jgi:hypothetical protein
MYAFYMHQTTTTSVLRAEALAQQHREDHESNERAQRKSKKSNKTTTANIPVSEYRDMRRINPYNKQ